MNHLPLVAMWLRSPTITIPKTLKLIPSKPPYSFPLEPDELRLINLARGGNQDHPLVAARLAQVDRTRAPLALRIRHLIATDR